MCIRVRWWCMCSFRQSSVLSKLCLSSAIDSSFMRWLSSPSNVVYIPKTLLLSGRVVFALYMLSSLLCYLVYGALRLT